ncbi:Pentatricopeptide repeat-containing protein [Camellia lanceoleosa]|uniref:Pentatricopeptide repeat-containing protein n=1 Tax=Camellia lanceoleosa TaxID=1840588 RepID=A0ACC0IPE4_9ERIC|nr:Pentatricopeptide repeat-containing protein [Camellia lanceoleosa]
MNTCLLDSANLFWSSSSFLTSTTRSTKVLTNPKNPSSPLLLIKAAKKRSQYPAQGLQRQPKKDLSRILRTEAAIKAIERKANSTKYNRLWPKAVLEALDDAIREHCWESALKLLEVLWKKLQTPLALLVAVEVEQEEGEGGTAVETFTDYIYSQCNIYEAGQKKVAFKYLTEKVTIVRNEESGNSAMCRDSCIVPGAAATEIELAKRLKEFSFKETGFFALKYVADAACIVLRVDPSNYQFHETLPRYHPDVICCLLEVPSCRRGTDSPHWNLRPQTSAKD